MNNIAGIPSTTDLFRQYDDERRIRLTKSILPAFIILVSLGFLQTMVTGNGIDDRQSFPFLLQSVSSGALTIVFIGAYILSRSRFAWWAPPLTQLGTSLTVFSYQLSNLLPTLAQRGQHSGQYQDVIFITSLGILVVLIGVIGSPLGVILMTLVNVVIITTLFIIYNAHGHFADQGVGVVSALGFQLIYQLAFAALMLGIMNGYRKVISDLGNATFAVERAKQLDSLKNQFISNVNHELRNPIMAMMGGLALIRQRAKRQEGSAEIEEMITRTEMIATHLRTMVQSILETHQLDTPVAPKENRAINILDVLAQSTDIVMAAEPEASTHKVIVDIPDTLAIWGDDFRLRQILSNLLSNAIKYSSPGTPIEISASVATRESKNHHRDESAMVEITVRDYGLGIPNDQITFLFNRFVRLPRDLTSTVVGNGLGLYLCRQYSENMSGTIRAESSGVPGEGSRFIICLPQPTVKQLTVKSK